jgi:tetratricopeptide (TPR) repeat protein
MKSIYLIPAFIALFSLALCQQSCRNQEPAAQEAPVIVNAGEKPAAETTDIKETGELTQPKAAETEPPEEMATELDDTSLYEPGEVKAPRKKSGRRSLYDTKQKTILRRQMVAAEERAYGKCPDNETVKELYKTAKEHLRDKDNDNDMETLQTLIGSCPGFAPAWFFKARILKNQDKFDEALAAYDKAIELDSLFIHPRFNKGRLLMFLYRYKEAAEAMLPILDISDELLDVHYSLAMVYAEERETFYESLLHYYKCRELDSGNALMPVISKEIAELELALNIESTVGKEDLKKKKVPRRRGND